LSAKRQQTRQPKQRRGNRQQSLVERELEHGALVGAAH
jgi:hypothetical protein